MVRSECSFGIMRDIIMTALNSKHTVTSGKDAYDEYVYIRSESVTVFVYRDGRAEYYEPLTDIFTVCCQKNFRDIFDSLTRSPGGGRGDKSHMISMTSHVTLHALSSIVTCGIIEVKGGAGTLSEKRRELLS